MLLIKGNERVTESSYDSCNVKGIRILSKNKSSAMCNSPQVVQNPYGVRGIVVVCE